MAPGSQRVPDTLGGLFQFSPVRPVRVARAEPQAEAVSVEAREDVQVDVEDLLTRRLAVGQIEVDPFAIESAPVECGGDPLGGTEHVNAHIFGKFGQARHVTFWHHENMTGVDGLDVHKRHTAPVAQDHARRQPARKYPAEDTTAHTTIMASAAVSKQTIHHKS